MLVTCGKLGLDWERLSISCYLEACYAASAEPDAKGEPTPEERDRLKRFMAAHGGDKKRKPKV